MSKKSILSNAEIEKDAIVTFIEENEILGNSDKLKKCVDDVCSHSTWRSIFLDPVIKYNLFDFDTSIKWSYFLSTLTDTIKDLSEKEVPDMKPTFNVDKPFDVTDAFNQIRLFFDRRHSDFAEIYLVGEEEESGSCH